ncbi:sortase [Patescibacteria group bacterium]
MQKTKILSIILFTAGVLLLSKGVYLLHQRNIPTRKFTEPTTVEKGILQPSSIEIPSINTKLPIILSTLENGRWQDPKDNVAYWNESPLPSEQGNSVYYGHSKKSVLGNLKEVNNGDQIVIGMSDGTEIKFRVADKFIVTSDQLHILSNTKDSRITLYTCTGFLDSKRLVVIATPND